MRLKEILEQSPYPEIGILYEGLPSEQDPVRVNCCGSLTAPSNVLKVHNGGTICLDCFYESTELVHCGWCNCVMTKADLVRFRDCPACGTNLVETE